MSRDSKASAPRELSSSATALAGGGASTVATVLTYPFDLIRTRFQVHDGRRSNLPQYGSTLRALQHIVAEEGFRGLYSGITPAVVGAGASWSMYLFGYSFVKRHLEKAGWNDGVTPILLGGVLAGITTAVATNPIWVIKTRMQTQLLSSADKSFHYSGIFNAASRIYKEEGVKAYYRGLTPAVLASYHGAVQFLIYETTCTWATGSHSSDNSPPGAVAFFAGGLSKVAALFSTQPLSVMKARLQEQRSMRVGDIPQYHGALDAFRKTWQKEGFLGFYKGIGPAMWRLALHSAMFFSILEQIKKYLRHFDSMVL